MVSTLMNPIPNSIFGLARVDKQLMHYMFFFLIRSVSNLLDKYPIPMIALAFFFKPKYSNSALRYKYVILMRGPQVSNVPPENYKEFTKQITEFLVYFNSSNIMLPY